MHFINLQNETQFHPILYFYIFSAWSCYEPVSWGLVWCNFYEYGFVNNLKWKEDNIVLGCIYLDDNAQGFIRMNYFEAYEFCWNLDAVLIEIKSEQQLAFLDQILSIKYLSPWIVLQYNCTFYRSLPLLFLPLLDWSNRPLSWRSVDLDIVRKNCWGFHLGYWSACRWHSP